MRYLLVFLFITTLTCEALAENRYVTDQLRVPLRKSPCGRCAILIGGVKTGTVLTFLEEQTPEGEREKWSKVKTSGGTIGWMPSQYLEREQVASFRLESMQAQVDKLNTRNATLQENLKQANAQVSSLTSELEKLTDSKRSINEELSQVKQISGDALAINEQNQELLKRNKILQNEVDVLSATNENLKSRTNQTWFLYGGILVAISAILSTLLPRLKRKKKFSEWA